MTLNIKFNWPMDQKSATVSMAMPNVEDSNYLFRMGVVDRSDKTRVGWINPGWTAHDKVEDLDVVVTREHIVVIEKKDKTTGELVVQHKWDITSEWPIEATGAAITFAPWTF